MRLMPFVEKAECILHSNACLDEFVTFFTPTKGDCKCDACFSLFCFVSHKIFLQILLRPKTYAVLTFD